MSVFKKDPSIGAKAYAEGKRMRADLKDRTPKPNKTESRVIQSSTSRLRHDSGRNN